MRTINIGKDKHEFISDWSEMTIRTFGELCKIEIPEKLKALWQSTLSGEKEWDAAFEAVTERDQISVFPEYFGRVMALLTKMPDEIIEQVDWELRSQFYYEYLHPFVLSTLYDIPVTKDQGKTVPYKPKSIRSFKHRDEKYDLPKTLRILGENVPMAEEPIVTFAESADIEAAMAEIGNKGAEALAMLIAVYARKPGEAYSQKRSLKRSRAFQELDMATAWSVFFYIAELTEGSALNLKSSLKPSEVIKRHGQPGPRTLTVSG